MSKYIERPEGTQEDVAEQDVLRNCACSMNLQHEQLSTGENMFAASDVARSKNYVTVKFGNKSRHPTAWHRSCYGSVELMGRKIEAKRIMRRK